MPNTKTYCKRGHLRDGDNLYVDSQGRLYCRACRSVTFREWRIKNRPSANLTPLERLLAKIDKSGPEPRPGSLAALQNLGRCWRWTGYLTASGRGRFRLQAGKPMQEAHRASYLLLVGPIPCGLHLDHLCQLPACVNPCHLEPVTPRVNYLRSNSPMATQARQTHCKRGHEFTVENTYVYGNHRACRACAAQRRMAS